jgi:hypothetical protein
MEKGSVKAAPFCYQPFRMSLAHTGIERNHNRRIEIGWLVMEYYQDWHYREVVLRPIS